MSLTPYDTGARAEPSFWVAPGNAASLDPAINPHADELRERYGKVDFNDTEDATLLTAWVEDAHGTVTLQVQKHLGLDKIVVDTQGEGAPEIVVDGVPQVGATVAPRFESTTPRGFGITQFEFRDYPDEGERSFSVQESSLATERRVWIGTASSRAHLTVADATRVRDALSAFIEGAS